MTKVTKIEVEFVAAKDNWTWMSDLDQETAMCLTDKLRLYPER